MKTLKTLTLLLITLSTFLNVGATVQNDVNNIRAGSNVGTFGSIITTIFNATGEIQNEFLELFGSLTSGGIPVFDGTTFVNSNVSNTSTGIVVNGDITSTGDVNSGGDVIVEGDINATRICDETGSNCGDLSAVTFGSLWNTNGAKVYYNAGNIGIGTNDPSEELHIESSTGGNQLLINGNTSGASPAIGAGIRLNSNNDTRGKGVFMTQDSNAKEWYAGTPYTGGGYSIGYDATGGQAEYDANSKFFVRTNGNVGIGTVSAGEKLEVVGNIEASGNLILGGTLLGDSITDGTIDSSEIQDNSLTANDLAANSVGNSELSNTANLYINNIYRSAHNTGHLVGSYNSVGANGARTNPIYSIGSSYRPGVDVLSNHYGVGYANAGQAAFIPTTGGWGMYVSSDGDARHFLDAQNGISWNTGGYKVDNTTVIDGSAWVIGDRISQNSIDDSEVQNDSLTASSLAANSVGNSELIDLPTFTNVISNNPTAGNHLTTKTYVDSQLGAIGIDDLSDGGADENSVYLGKGAGNIGTETANRYNVGVGVNSLNNTTSGSQNVAVGRSALYSNTTGRYSVSLGDRTLYSNSSGGFNTVSGYQGGYNNTTGSNNTAMGYRSLYSNTVGNYNNAVGVGALYSNTTTVGSTAMGHNALYNNNKNYNAAFGYEAARANTTGYMNTAVGAYRALYSNTTGSYNVGIGQYSIYSATASTGNVGVGHAALYRVTSGNYNTAVGYDSGRYTGAGAADNNASSSNSVYLGYRSRPLASGQTNQVVIGHNATGNGSNSVTLGADTITKTVLKGNVGIGTTGPDEVLEVSKDVDPSTDTVYMKISNPSTLNWHNTEAATGIMFEKAGLATGFIESQHLRGSDSVDHSNEDAGLAFGTRTDQSNPPTTKMVINNAGNVGIGTTAPTQRLQVTGNAVVSGNITGTNVKTTCIGNCF